MGLALGFGVGLGVWGLGLGLGLGSGSGCDLDGVREGGAPRDHGVAAVEAELRRDLAEDETVPQAVRERAVRVEVGQLGGLVRVRVRVRVSWLGLAG